MKLTRIYSLLPIAICLLAISCGDETKPIAIPQNVLAKDKMAQVLSDIHIAEAEANLRTLPDSTSKASIGFEKVFEKHSISSAQFDTSLSFYINNPLLLDSVYADVMDDLSRRQAANQ